MLSGSLETFEEVFPELLEVLGFDSSQDVHILAVQLKGD